MHPSIHARSNPGKPAVIMAASGETISYAELDRRSNQVAQLLRARGIGIGDTVAICLENHPWFFALTWGAQRAGLHYVCISSRLTAPEVAYIVADSGARLLIGSSYLASVLDEVAKLTPDVPQLRFGGVGELDAEAALCAMPCQPIADERAGVDMLYSSGTTGRPKGVKIPLPEDPDIAQATALVGLASMAFGITPEAVYLSPAPLYHAAPLRWSMTVHKLGGTVVVMERFDAEEALKAIEQYRITDSQWVPTHFVRMLKLPDEVRARYDTSTLKCAIHAAAPCPVPVKRAMIEWWGPVLFEYYAGTEGNGFTFISSAEWLERPGSVGRALTGIVRVCDENGDEVPRGTEGQIFFEPTEGNVPFEYHNDPAKTAESRNKHGWTSLGDVGIEDEEGYVFLTDRKSFMIIAGGVNIYPQEIENLLVTHPKVTDAAVIGAPDPDLGEKVVAVIQPVAMAEAGPALADELMAWLAPQLSRIKLPRQIDFREQLPREATGKLYKRLLRDEYKAAYEAAS
ncbi:MAG: acyl-CoA synthetase [Novosphingobium sp.]|uniref:acyl-CoA synthetase n=1 Tax=Novosphingobium sp. TaxID=1874826 RepID=UPI001D8B4A7B|nr:acyl-CoA synthetase [Novosphingobium sp.]MCB2057090.1 acyl-CoA synthetase [Novosphingobium sp.]MCP5387487.1 acyl-CoA synthetase [Novosphingobium sp.]